MGCDIHLQVEKRNAGGNWEYVPYVPMEKCWNCEGSGKRTTVEWDRTKKPPVRIDTKHDEPCSTCDGKGMQLYHSRSYDTFAILANVRNGSGFAGVKTGEGFNFISEPKGLPADMDLLTGSEECFEEGRCPWLGDHSHSWLTLKEILDFDWDQTTGKQGWVTPAEYQTFKEKGVPDSWAGGVSGGSVAHVSNQRMEAIIKEEPEVLNPKREFNLPAYYTLVKWTVKYSETVHSFYTDAIPALKKLAGDVGPENVRIVFGFDS